MKVNPDIHYSKKEAVFSRFLQNMRYFYSISIDRHFFTA